MEQNIFDKIKEVSQNGISTPSTTVWDKLESKLMAESQSSSPTTKTFNFKLLKNWSIAASVLVLIGAYGVLNHLSDRSLDSTVIQLEDLNTIEVNPRQNVAPFGESSTIPSIQMARSIHATYKGINEGSADKKLMTRRQGSEYGLG